MFGNSITDVKGNNFTFKKSLPPEESAVLNTKVDVPNIKSVLVQIYVPKLKCSGLI